MKIIKASRGTPEDLIDAVNSKIAELGRVGASTTIKADTGTPEDLMYAVTDKIAELEDGVAASTDIQASTYVDPDGMLLDAGVEYTKDELEDFYNDIHDGDPVVSQYDTFEDWLHDTVDHGYLKVVDAAENIMCHDDHDIDWDKLWEISDRYVTSTPLSGSWDTEVEHEQRAIAGELGVSMEEAKHLMIEHLQFPPEVFEDASLVASTKVCSGVEVIDRLGIDPNELWEVVDKYTTSTPVSGDWDTEIAAEQQEIADHFGISLEDAKKVMIEYLGFFDDDKFIEACDDVYAADSFEADPDMIGMTYDEISAAEDVDDIDDVNEDTEEDETTIVDDFYAHDLQGAIEKAIMEKVPNSTVVVDDDGVGEESDDDYEPITELYVTVTTPDVDPEGRPSINDYTVPMEDLTGNIDEDVEYVLKSVEEIKDTDDEESEEED